MALKSFKEYLNEEENIQEALPLLAVAGKALAGVGARLGGSAIARTAGSKIAQRLPQMGSLLGSAIKKGLPYMGRNNNTGNENQDSQTTQEAPPRESGGSVQMATPPMTALERPSVQSSPGGQSVHRKDTGNFAAPQSAFYRALQGGR
jgi:hypothetical protein